MPAAVAMRVYREHQAFYDQLQLDLTKAAGQAPVDPDAVLASVAASSRLSAIVKKFNAAVLLISGCQDKQTSLDGDHNGTFTEQLLRFWSNGSFKGNYGTFHAGIKAALPATQTPNLFILGRPGTFLAQTPFTVWRQRMDCIPTPAAPVTLVQDHAHQDQALCDELQGCLKRLEHHCLSVPWHDGQTGSGRRNEEPASSRTRIAIGQLGLSESTSLLGAKLAFAMHRLTEADAEGGHAHRYGRRPCMLIQPSPVQPPTAHRRGPIVAKKIRSSPWQPLPRKPSLLSSLASSKLLETLPRPPTAA